MDKIHQDCSESLGRLLRKLKVIALEDFRGQTSLFLLAKEDSTSQLFLARESTKHDSRNLKTEHPGHVLSGTRSL